jgi:hypothetical protein
MIRKLIIKQKMGPILPTRTRLLNVYDYDNKKRTKYLEQNRCVSPMEHRQTDKQVN